MTLSERIRAAMADAGMNQTELARACGVQAPSVHGWMSGKAKFLRGENLLRAAKALQVNQEWLATGKGSMRPQPDDQILTEIKGARQVVGADQDDPNFVQIPMVKLRLSAGVTGFQVDTDFADGGTIGMRKNWLERFRYNPEKLVAISVKGDSMEPSLYDGDIVVINTAETKPIDGRVFAVNYEGEPVVKRLSRDAGEWWLTSDSPDQRRHHRKLCRGEACIIIGRVVRKESDQI